eukprot:TRINITY_DN5504_c0_g1_i1.p1 TRINITY_DN5504_c0_g1~~TRINITY_DN5504_c0_g1_i1.p1  ORF type:complete len:124 (+),score=12.70 TRINITY_DN5504_c0_g1_i1:125-496(+)
MNWDIRQKQISEAGYEIKLVSNGEKLNQSTRKLSKFEKAVYQQYSSINIPRCLTNMLPTGILQFIPHCYDYVLKACSLHGDNEYLYLDKTIKIFNLATADLTTNEPLYFIAEQYEERNFWPLV